MDEKQASALRSLSRYRCIASHHGRKGIVQVIWESTGRTQAVKVCCSWGMLGDFLKPQNIACQHGSDPAADVT